MNRREFAISLGTIAAVIAGGASEVSESASGAATLKPKVVGGDKCQSAGKFAVGQSVQIRNDIQPIGDYRTPIYVRGKIGTIERILPCFINPEEEGYGKNARTMDRLTEFESARLSSGRITMGLQATYSRSKSLSHG